jgi:hypothetical protein
VSYRGYYFDTLEEGGTFRRRTTKKASSLSIEQNPGDLPGFHASGWPFCVCVVEGCGTEDYRLLHLRDERQFREVPGRHIQPSHAAFQVDCHLQLLEEIHSQNSIKLPAAGFRDGG